jgi:hypothetical protein
MDLEDATRTSVASWTISVARFANPQTAAALVHPDLPSTKFLPYADTQYGVESRQRGPREVRH